MGWHLFPIDDVVEHTPSDDCVCVPAFEPVERPDGSMDWLAAHQLLVDPFAVEGDDETVEETNS